MKVDIYVVCSRLKYFSHDEIDVINFFNKKCPSLFISSLPDVIQPNNT